MNSSMDTVPLQITPQQSKYYAHELIRRHPADSPQKLTATLSNARVDLNPHQVDAALFAFRSPLSRGAILADEVGLGKTIEAGLILSQIWAERKRKILIIVPSNLRQQWQEELWEKFFLPSQIIEGTFFNDKIKQGVLNPFDFNSEIVICSYHFARNKSEYVQRIPWDLTVFDEAHRLRNVYKADSKIANELRDKLEGTPKLLLTATPLQNSLLELYGLVSFIDGYIFGDLKSFKAQFGRITERREFEELKQRIAPICKRTLRRQVTEYVPYTERHAIVEPFTPTDDEQQLYSMVSEYLRRENLQALPRSQRTLMTLVLRKLLASSTFAIAGALQSLAKKLTNLLESQAEQIAEAPEQDFEAFQNVEEEWVEEEDNSIGSLSQQDIVAIEQEIKDLEAFYELALSITENAKGYALLRGLSRAFQQLKELGAPKKAIIFTESRRTQLYLQQVLSDNGYAGELVLFNGSNSDSEAQRIYREWMESYANSDRATGNRGTDTRTALVDYFRNHASVMIATEAAAEGINLQFCPLVVNYDLPWNPQRVEQRIGRCHRYGQKHDVVVVNFLNEKNEADQRVYRLLADKFRLFDGVFGASDEVLGALETGVDFEKRIVQIYQQCRTSEEISRSFDALQKEMEADIASTLKETRQKLLENFDQEVAEKLKFHEEEGKKHLHRFDNWLWKITHHYLADYAEFHGDHSFYLYSIPNWANGVHTGMYRMLRRETDAFTYRVGHPLAQAIINRATKEEPEQKELTFDYTGSPLTISALESYLNTSGWLAARYLSVESLDDQDQILITAVSDDGNEIEPDLCSRMLDLPVETTGDTHGRAVPEQLKNELDRQNEQIIEEINAKNLAHFDSEMHKLDTWAEDRKLSLEKELSDLDKQIQLMKSEARRQMDLNEKVKLQRKTKELEKKRNTRRKNLFETQDEIETQKEQLLNDLEDKLEKKIQSKELFTVRWCLK